MDDILFGNNNQATINRLAKRSYRANKQRNVFVTIALFLTAFMITSVFSLGCSYFETYQMQQIRAMGTTADVAITSLSEEQYEELSRSSLVSVVGVSQRLGSIDTSGMDDALLSITWIDETEWQEHRVQQFRIYTEIIRKQKMKLCSLHGLCVQWGLMIHR